MNYQMIIDVSTIIHMNILIVLPSVSFFSVGRALDSRTRRLESCNAKRSYETRQYYLFTQSTCFSLHYAPMFQQSGGR